MQIPATLMLSFAQSVKVDHIITSFLNIYTVKKVNLGESWIGQVDSTQVGGNTRRDGRSKLVRESLRHDSSFIPVQL